MRKGLLSVAILVLFFSAALAGDEEVPWFDFENCAMCEPFMSQEGLMEDMSMEILNQDQGMVEVVTVSPDFLEAYRTASGQCMAVADRLEKGEDLPLCGMCQAFGKLMAEGAVPQFIPSIGGSVTLLTSDDPAVIAKIHEWTDRTNTEMAALMAAPEAAEE